MAQYSNLQLNYYTFIANTFKTLETKYADKEINILFA
jgi:hypothetical protein